MKANYHTHNALCRHAGGTLEEYARMAAVHGFTELGMSDHLPFPGDPFGMRMRYDELAGYVEETNRLKHVYAPSLRILLGAEAEYIPDYDRYYERLLTRQGFDYLIMGQHFFAYGDFGCANVYHDIKNTEDLLHYVDASLEGMATGYFAYWAHPDLFFVNSFSADVDVDKAIDRIVNACVKHGYMLEWNANGLRRDTITYPSQTFWQAVAGTEIPVIIGADCHSTDALEDWAVLWSEEETKRLGLHVVEHLA